MSAIAACGPDIPPMSPIPDPGLLAQPLAYQCGGLIFDPALFDGPADAEQAQTPLAAILRDYVAQTAREGDPLPEAGWHLLEKRIDGADFLATREVVGEGTEVLSVTVQLNVSLARRASWNRCRPKAVMRAGLNVGSWSLDAAKPRQSAHVLRLLVQEQSCASGRSPEGRIVGPAIRTGATSVVILFGIAQLSAGVVTCQGNPSTWVDVDLGEAIGDRDLIDPSDWPSVSIRIAP
jgi:hypothetical protein